MRYIETKLYPTSKGRYKHLYYKVFVFLQKRSMYKFREKLVEDGSNKMMKPDRYLALCSAYNSKKDKNQYGVLLFTKASARRSGIVSHEITHATTYWFKYVEKKNKIYTDPRADESFARMLGSMVSQYWKLWYTFPAAYRK